MFVYSYNKFSEGAKELSHKLGVKRIKSEGSKFKAKANKLVINWGSSVIPPHIEGCNVLNKNAVNAQNKLHAFQKLEGNCPIPEFTQSREKAEKWLADGVAVVCRTVLNGKGGKGITIADTPDQLVDAPLYVKYVPKKDEYRIHVFNGKVIHQQRKARNRDVEDVNWRIRNLANGFIFAIGDCNPPAACNDASIAAVAALGLDFGAVDVIWNEKQEKAYVLEVNTAPGLQGTTVEKYMEAFNELR